MTGTKEECNVVFLGPVSGVMSLVSMTLYLIYNVVHA